MEILCAIAIIAVLIMCFVAIRHTGVKTIHHTDRSKMNERNTVVIMADKNTYRVIARYLDGDFNDAIEAALKDMDLTDKGINHDS